jgi:flagellar biogenesis protein FliO
MLKNLSVALIFLLQTSLFAVEVTKITPKAIDPTNIQLDIEFDGRMVTPPYFIPYKNSVAIKWQNATFAGQNFINQNDFEITTVQDSLVIAYKKSLISASDISKLSLKLAGNSVKTILPQMPLLEKKLVPAIPNPIKDNETESSKKTPVEGIESIEKKSPEIVKKDTGKSEKEDYLSYLLSSVDKESEKNALKKLENPTLLKTGTITRENKEVVKKSTTPIINVDKNLESKEAKNFTSYMLRIVIVLSFIVGVIFLLAKISKKIMLGKNKLGFLNNSKIVEILNTTYIAPKRQLLLVKVHDQVMLLANSETGLSFISEVHDLSNLLKKAEVEVTGTNFDTDLESDNKNDSRITLKDSTRLYESTPIENKSSKMRSVLKNKAKSLKAWQ